MLICISNTCMSILGFLKAFSLSGGIYRISLHITTNKIYEILSKHHIPNMLLNIISACRRNNISFFHFFLSVV